jgi:DNA modification methylase
MRESRKEILAEGVELWLGDCREVLPLLGKVDAVVTDPPYGVGVEYGSFDDTSENVAALLGIALPLMQSMAKRVALTPGNGPFLWSYPRADWVLNWTDPAGEGMCRWGFQSWQPILVWGKCPFLTNGLGGRSDTVVKRFLRDDPVDHPCPKPLGFMRWLVNRVSLPKETILDPFMGSGTTGVAAVKLGRRFIGIEIEPKYFEIACWRISEALKQPDLFIERPKPAKQEAFL